MHFTNSLDPDQAHSQQNDGPDLDQTDGISERIFSKKLILKLISEDLAWKSMYCWIY